MAFVRGLVLCLVFVFSTMGGEAEDVADLFIAPCCWRESVRVHRSPEAAAIRADIAQRIANGEKRESIIDAYVRKYGVRILRDPPKKQRAWLDLMPWVFTAVGLALLIWFVRGNLTVRTS